MIGLSYASEPVLIASGKVRLAGVLELPRNPCGMVLFPHDGGSHRPSPRSSYLAGELRRAGLATLLLGLRAPHDDAGKKQQHCIDLLGARLAAAANWLAAEPETRHLALGLFGTGGNAAAALRYAACRPQRVAAVVARGGRPDLAGTDALSRVRAPTLLMVSEQDHAGIECNRRALKALDCEKDLAVIRGAPYPGEEPRMLDEMVRLAARWFRGYFGASTRPALWSAP